MMKWIRKKLRGKHIHDEPASRILNNTLRYLLEFKQTPPGMRTQKMVNMKVGIPQHVPILLTNWKFDQLMNDEFIVRVMDRYSSSVLDAYYNITEEGIKFINKGGYISQIERPKPMPLTDEQKRQRRRDSNDRFTYYKNLFWLGSIIIGVPYAIQFVSTNLFDFNFFQWIKDLVN